MRPPLKRASAALLERMKLEPLIWPEDETINESALFRQCEENPRDEETLGD